MKVLFIGVFDYQSTNTSQAICFENSGCEVIRYNYRVRASEIGLSQRDTEIIDVCKKEKPNLVIFSKCNQVNINVVVECNQFSKTILWYMDPPDNIDFELIYKAALCKYVFCALSDPFDILKKYNKNTFFLEEGFDPLSNFPVANQEQIYDVSFIGSLRGTRADYHRELGFKVFDNAYGKEHSIAVAQTKINLNLTAGNGGTSDRIYKLLASGGFVLSEEWPRMNDSFPMIDWHRGFITFKGLEDLKEKIEYFLATPLIRYSIAGKGFEAVQKYNRNNWAKRILEKVS